MPGCAVALWRAFSTFVEHHLLCLSSDARHPCARLLRPLRGPLHGPGTRTREEGFRRIQSGVLTRVRPSDEERGRGYGFERMIPLEALSARTVIVHMRAVRQIELVTHCSAAGWAIQTVMASTFLQVFLHQVPFLLYVLTPCVPHGSTTTPAPRTRRRCDVLAAAEMAFSAMAVPR